MAHLTRRLSWALALAALVLLTPPATAGTAEAERQLLFARGELEAGRFDRAVSSAESALRLDPGLYRAMVVKALALEGLGEFARAESMLVAYFELTAGIPAPEEAEAALARLQAREGESGAPAGPPEMRRSGDELRFDRVDASNQFEVSQQLSESLRGWGWIASYRVSCPDPSTEHELNFPDKGFFFRVDKDRELKIVGQDELVTGLKRGWRCGGDAEPNDVELRFDGERLTARLNDATFGPLWVRREGADEDRTRWKVILRGDDVVISDLALRPWSSEPVEPIRFDRVAEHELRDAADRLNREWEQGRFHMSYTVTAGEAKSSHTIELADLAFYFRVDRKGVLVMRGAEDLKVELGSRWSRSEPNRVDLWFDGDALVAQVGDEAWGPVRVREGVASKRTMKWVLKVGRDSDVFTDVVVQRWSPPPAP